MDWLWWGNGLDACYPSDDVPASKPSIFVFDPIQYEYYTELRKGRRRSKEEVGDFSLLYVWLIPPPHVECSYIRSGVPFKAIQSSHRTTNTE